MMRRLSIILGVMILAFSMNAQNIMLQTGSKGVAKTSDAFTGFQATFSYDQIESVTITGTERGTFSDLSIANAMPAGEVGAPQLPVFKQFIAVPVGATPKVSVKNFTVAEYRLDDYDIHTVYPVQPPVPKTQNLEDAPFVYDVKVYGRNEYTRYATAEVEVLGTMRGVIMGMLVVRPIQYNPVANTIMVYNDIDVEVTFENGDYAKTQAMYVNTYSPYFEPFYTLPINRNLFDDHPDLYSTPVHMLVLANSMFTTTLQPWLEWKTKKGFYVDYVEVNGMTNTQLRTLCQTKYNQGASNGTAPTFVVVVGDVQQVPASKPGTTSDGNRASDLYYGSVDGDFWPEMYYSRLSAQTTQQLANQIEKILYYEKYQFADPTYLDNVLLIAGADGSWNPKVAQPTINYATTNWYNSAHGYVNIYKYLTSYTGCYANLNNVGFANYTAHGSETGWSDPSFGVSQVNGLTNANKYFIAMGNCCLAADFGYNECFGEAMVRAQQKGAVGYIGSCPLTYWNEDFHFGVGAYMGSWSPCVPTPANTINGLYDMAFRDADFNCLSSYVYAGNVAVTYAKTTPGYEHYSGISNTYYWEAYNVLGDASLMPYNTQGADNTVSHPSDIFIGLPTYEVQAVPGSYVAISKDGVLRGVAVANTSGIAIVTLDSPITSGGMVDIVVTRNQYKPYMAQVQAVAQSGPYIVTNGYSVPAEEKLTYISTNTEIEVALKNVGIETTDNLTVTISCENPQLTIVNGTATCSGIAPDGSAIVKFKVTVSHDIPDDITFMADVDVVEAGKGGTWNNKLPLKAYAPVFSLEKILVNGVADGNLEVGTVAALTTVVKNKGGADAYKVKGNLDIHSPYITFACEDQIAIGQNLPAGETIEIPFYVITSSEMPYGHVANIDLLLNAQYERSDIAPFTVSNSISGSYCSSGSQDCSDGDMFSSVILYKTSEPSNLLINKPSINCTSGGYTDFTDVIFPVEPGVQYTIKVKKGPKNYSNTIRGWFDLNGNNEFESGEQLISLAFSTANQEVSQNFTIPQDTEPGIHRFRLVTKYSGTPTACNNSSFGHTVDFSAFFPEVYLHAQNVVAVLNENSITVTWDAPASGTPIGYNIYRGVDKLNTAPLTETTFTEEDITQGVYVYNVTAIYAGNKESYAETSNVICNFLPCIMPIDLSVEVEGNTAILTWEDSNEMAGTLSGYNVFRNGTKIADLVKVKEYIDENLSGGTYNYQISAVYEHCESEMTDKETITILPCEAPTNMEVAVDNNTAIITWNEPENIEGVELLGYNVYRDGEKLNDDPIEETEYVDADLPVGTYSYQVSAVYEHCPESGLTEEISITILPPLPCDMPTDLAGEADNHTAILTWNEPEDLEEVELLGYNLYRDGDKINEELIEETEYRDEDLPNGEYLYQVAAVYVHCEESEWTEGVVVIIDVTAINDIQTATYKIFPNPTTGEFRVISYGLQITGIEIFDVMGRKVQSFEVKVSSPETQNPNPETVINISHLPSGVYFIRIDSDHGSTTQKLIFK